jgi:methylmalonyl-CoA mutase N-terminal domain/subunit
MRQAIESGWVQGEIQDVAFERQREVESGDRVIVGVNEFRVEDEERAEDIETVSDEEVAKQIDRLESLRADRDDEAVEAKLEALRTACETGENVMPYIVDAVKAHATTGEVADAMRDVFGEHRGGV